MFFEGHAKRAQKRTICGWAPLPPLLHQTEQIGDRSCILRLLFYVLLVASDVLWVARGEGAKRTDSVRDRFEAGRLFAIVSSLRSETQFYTVKKWMNEWNMENDQLSRLITTVVDLKLSISITTSSKALICKNKICTNSNIFHLIFYFISSIFFVLHYKQRNEFPLKSGLINWLFSSLYLISMHFVWT